MPARLQLCCVKMCQLIEPKTPLLVLILFKMFIEVAFSVSISV